MKQTCADFVLVTRLLSFSLEADNYFDEDIIKEISSNTTQSLSGCGYKLIGEDPIG